MKDDFYEFLLSTPTKSNEESQNFWEHFWLCTKIFERSCKAITDFKKQRKKFINNSYKYFLIYREYEFPGVILQYFMISC